MPRAGAVLLVEDDTNDVDLIQLALERAARPFDIYAVPHGREAVKYLLGEDQYADRQAFPFPDLILLDLTMPVMDGFDLLRWMQQQPGRQWPPVFVFSYSRLERDVRLARQLGASQYLLKPVDLDAAICFIESLDKFRKGGEMDFPAPAA